MSTLSQEEFEDLQQKIISKFGGLDKIKPIYRVIRNPFECAVNKMTIPDLYQRTIQPSRAMQICKQMDVLGGYDRAKPIVLNEEFQVVDGQHRLLAVQMRGGKKIWVVIYEFASFEDEVTYWIWAQKNMAPPGPDQFWHSQYLVKNPYAELIYNLCQEDPTSVCNGFVAIKTAKTKKKKLTLAVFLQILNHVGLNLSTTTHWGQDHDAAFAKRIKEIGYQNIKESMNDFFTWFFTIYGKDKYNNPGYDKQVIFAVVRIFKKMYDQGLLRTTRGYNFSVKKFQSADYAKPKVLNFKTADYVEKFVSDINDNRQQKNRVVM